MQFSRSGVKVRARAMARVRVRVRVRAIPSGSGVKVRARARVIAIPSGSGVKVLKSGKIHTGATNMRNTCNSAYPRLQPYVCVACHAHIAHR